MISPWGLRHQREYSDCSAVTGLDGTARKESVRELIAKGKLVQVLKDWCPSFPGYFLYYPSRRNQPAALAALIREMKVETSGK